MNFEDNKNNRQTIFPISGLNSNISLNDATYHLQTEVLPAKQIVHTNIYKNGEIIYSDFISFKKYFEDEKISDNQLKKGISQIVTILHDRAKKWLINSSSSQKKRRQQTTSIKWLEKVKNNLKTDYPDKEFFIMLVEEERKVVPVGKKPSENHILKISELLVYNILHFMNNSANDKMQFFIFSSNYGNFCFVSIKEEIGIIYFDTSFPAGLIKIEIERYLSLFNNERIN